MKSYFPYDRAETYAVEIKDYVISGWKLDEQFHVSLVDGHRIKNVLKTLSRTGKTPRTDARRLSLYFGSELEEMEREARRLDRSTSQIIQRAVEIALPTINTFLSMEMYEYAGRVGNYAVNGYKRGQYNLLVKEIDDKPVHERLEELLS